MRTNLMIVGIRKRKKKKSCIHVTVDFVSPESLPSDNFQKEYKLKMKKLLRVQLPKLWEIGKKIPWGLSGETFSLGFLTRKAKMMRLLMEREGHKCSHAERNMLEDEIQNFLNASSTGSRILQCYVAILLSFAHSSLISTC